MKTILVTSATGEPIGLGEMKRQLRLSTSTGAEDSLISGYIRAARRRCENYTGRKMLTQTWKVYHDNWPSGEYFDLPYPPLQGIDSSGLIYKNSTGSNVTVWSSAATNAWERDKVSEPGRLHLQYGESWPSGSLWNDNPISIQFVCGYGSSSVGDSSSVPEDLKLGMKLLAGHWYENRENTIVGQTINKIPDATDALWYPYRIWDKHF